MENLFGPAQQQWVCQIPIMQQSVLFAAIRAPDGIRKNHPVKVLMRWYRRCVLLSAFDKRALTDPFFPGGGSFTGPLTLEHCIEIWGRSWSSSRASVSTENVWSRENGTGKWQCMDRMRHVYFDHVDELPHHFQLHLMHAAQIIGVHHPLQHIREWWNNFYRMIVNDAHLYCESDEEMNLRLSDNSEAWKAREVVTAK